MTHTEHRPISAEPARIVVESHGVTIEIVLDDPALAPRVEPLLPPGSHAGDPAAIVARFQVGAAGTLRANDEVVVAGADEDTALGALDAAVRSTVALHATDRVFVHAGVVARDERAIVIPGASLSGKSTLVAALVAAGATYYSDEFAVLDREGRVHPYAKPLSVRQPGSFAQREVPPAALGEVGTAPATVAVIAALPFTGMTSALHPGASADGALALLSNAIAARARPAAVLEAVRAAATDAIYVEGTRGDADVAARQLLELIDGRDATAQSRPAPPTQAVPRG